MPTTAELLREARAVIADPKRWTKGCTARDENGRPAIPGGTRAVSFCAIGAVVSVCTAYPVALHPARNLMAHYLDRAACQLSGDDEMSTEGFNDDNDHDDVMAMFDLAIEMAGGAQQQVDANERAELEQQSTV
jgi:hypothetical protein